MAGLHGESLNPRRLAPASRLPASMCPRCARAARPARRSLPCAAVRAAFPATRGVITRWQAARGYPASGYLNTLQHKALLTEIVAVAPTASTEEDRPKRRTASPQQAQPQQAAPPPQRHYNNNPGPDPAGAGRFIGGVVGGMLR